MQLSIATKVRTGFGFGLVLLAFVGIGAFWSISNLKRVAQENERVNQTVEAAQQLLSDLKDAETGERGYLLTDKQKYLEPYYTGISEIKNSSKKLNGLLSKQANAKEAEVLNALIQLRLSKLALVLQLRQTKGLNAALQVVNSDLGKAYMDKIRVVIRRLDKDLRQQQQDRETEVFRSIYVIAYALGGLSVVVVGLVGFAIFNVEHELNQRFRLEAKLKESEDLYRSVVKTMAEGVVIQNAEGVILTCNASAERILGLSQDQMMGRTSIDPRWHTVYEDSSPFLGQDHPAMRTLQTGKAQSEVVMGVYHKDESLHWISIGCEPQWNTDKTQVERVVTTFSDFTDRQCAQFALQQSEAELLALFEAMHDLVLVRDIEGRCLKILSSRSEYLLRPIEEMLYKTLHETFPEAQADLLLKSIRQALEMGQTVMCEYSFDMKGKTRWFATNISPLSQETVTLVIREISDRKRLEQELFEEKELAQVTLHSIGDAVITTDTAGNINYFNPAAQALTGWSPAEACGLPLAQVFKIINEINREPVDNLVQQALKEGKIVSLAEHSVLLSRDGCETPIKDSAAPIRNREGKVVGAVMVFQDVTQARNLSRQLSWQANHDPLTQLVNRREFERRVEQAMTSAISQQQHALCFLDLDQFKIVNDTCGHSAGDELLRQVTVLLQAKVRKTDTLARLGGDEFGVLLVQCPLSQALRVANEMRECIRAFRFVWEEQTFNIGVSIGLIMIDTNSKSLSELLSFADAACYSAKNKGRNRVHVFQPDDQELLQQRGEMQWVNRITRALEEDRFCLYYQTIAVISAQSTPTPNNGEHYEVLLRLRDEKGNLVAPMAFIPAAERYGLMHLIDRWVIRTVFTAQGQHYRDILNQCKIQGHACDALYAINLSGASLNDDQFIDFLHEQFSLHQIPPQLICFEITETMAISNLTKASRFIHELQQLGCRFALDDFGSGMSSFGYLKNLPVDYLKIDGEFVRNIINDPINDVMVEAMTRIGHVMGIKIIAEFVENDAILTRLTTLGVDYAQGYGIAKPLPLL